MTKRNTLPGYRQKKRKIEHLINFAVMLLYQYLQSCGEKLTRIKKEHLQSVYIFDFDTYDAYVDLIAAGMTNKEAMLTLEQRHYGSERSLYRIKAFFEQEIDGDDE